MYTMLNLFKKRLRNEPGAGPGHVTSDSVEFAGVQVTLNYPLFQLGFITFQPSKSAQLLRIVRCFRSCIVFRRTF
jgi:hypothetical protein